MKHLRTIIQLVGLLGGAALVVVFLGESPKEKPSIVRSSRISLHADPYQEEIDKRASKRPYGPYYDLRVFNREKSSPGLTLFGVNETEEILLLANDGRLLNRWPIDSDRAILMPSTCSLAATHGTVSGAKISPWKSLRYMLREYGRTGGLLWEYRSPDILHHDLHYMADQDAFLTLRRRLVPYQGTQKFQEDFQVKADGILVVNRAGEDLFTWNAEEHIPHDFCGIRECPTAGATLVSRAEFKRRKDWIHANTVSVVPANKWFDEGDTRFRPGNYLIHLRNFWMSYIIDSKTKETVWRFPEKKEYEENPDFQIFGGHESHMIPSGLPGAGNLLLFDNGSLEKRPYTRILEIDPVKRKLVWSYENRGHFFSRTAGAVQRLPGGNTLISEDLQGRVFEVTPEGEIVWEVDTPYRTARAHRYPLDWCNGEMR